MTFIGTGVGGNIGGPPTPSQYETETTASTLLARASLGIVSDSIEQSFIQLNPRYSTGYLGGFGYKSAASRPLLDHPLESTKIVRAPQETKNESWNSLYEQFVSQLPSDLQSRYIEDTNRPFQERNLNFVALENSLTTAAQVFGKASLLPQSGDADGLENIRTTLNLLLPFAALKGGISYGDEVSQGASSALIKLGANYTQFDSSNHVINELIGPLNILRNINSSLSQTSELDLNPGIKAAATTAAAQLSTISNQLSRASIGNDLLILLATTQALATVASALSLPNTGSAPLFLGASIATIGIFNKTSDMGMVGISLNNVINAVNQGVLINLMPDVNAASGRFFSMLATIGFLSLMSITSLSIDSGLGPYPDRAPDITDAAKLLALETFLSIFSGSDILKNLYQETIAVSSGDTNAQNIGSTILSSVALSLIILTASQKTNKSPEDLIQTNHAYLRQGILAAEECFNTVSSSNDISTTTAVALAQSKVALDENNPSGALDAYANVIESLGLSPSAILKDIKTVTDDTAHAADLITPNIYEQQVTSIINIV